MNPETAIGCRHPVTMARPPVAGSRPRGRPPGTTKTDKEKQEAQDKRTKDKKERSQLRYGLSSFLQTGRSAAAAATKDTVVEEDPAAVEEDNELATSWTH